MNVSHDAGTVSGVTVTGTITVTNPNVDSGDHTVPVSGVDVTDTLSDSTVCAVTGGSGVTLTAFKTDFAYTCDLSALPQGELDNAASVSWGDQFLDNGAALNSGSANFTFKNIAFSASLVDDSVSVSDSRAACWARSA